MPAIANPAIGRLALASARATNPRRSASRPGRVSAFHRRRAASLSVVACASDASPPDASPSDASARETSLPSRRLALASALGVVAGAAAIPLPSSAGEVLNQLQNLLADAEAAIEADPENDALIGQRTFFENQLERVQLNATFVDRLRPRVASGDVAYLQRIVLTVDANLWDDELYFWKNAMGMRVTRETPDGACLAFGQETLDADDGGKAAVELRRGPPGARQLGNGLAHISLRVPYGVRVSRIYESGGELVYGFGYFDVRSPSGYAVRAAVAARRDPVEYVAVNVESVREAEKYYAETFGMVGRAPLDLNGYAPKAPPGSRLMTFGEPNQTAGVLLQPLAAAVDDASEGLKVGEVYSGVVFVRKEGGEPGVDAGGYAVGVEAYDEWEKAVAKGAAALPAKYNAPPPA